MTTALFVTLDFLADDRQHDGKTQVFEGWGPKVHHFVLWTKWGHHDEGEETCGQAEEGAGRGRG